MKTAAEDALTAEVSSTDSTFCTRSDSAVHMYYSSEDKSALNSFMFVPLVSEFLLLLDHALIMLL
jgi:hypothetical protein